MVDCITADVQYIGD